MNVCINGQLEYLVKRGNVCYLEIMKEKQKFRVGQMLTASNPWEGEYDLEVTRIEPDFALNEYEELVKKVYVTVVHFAPASVVDEECLYKWASKWII